MSYAGSEIVSENWPGPDNGVAPIITADTAAREP